MNSPTPFHKTAKLVTSKMQRLLRCTRCAILHNIT